MMALANGKAETEKERSREASGNSKIVLFLRVRYSVHIGIYPILLFREV